jgi:hypothetical protein
MPDLTMPTPTTPFGVGLFVAVSVGVYLLLLSFSPYLPAILILSGVIGYLVYKAQSQCSCPAPARALAPTGTQPVTA